MSRMSTAIWARFAASATSVKSFRNASVDGGRVWAGAGAATFALGEICMEEEDDERVVCCDVEADDLDWSIVSVSSVGNAMQCSFKAPSDRSRVCSLMRPASSEGVCLFGANVVR
jgi:hypothetical protein